MIMAKVGSSPILPGCEIRAVDETKVTGGGGVEEGEDLSMDFDTFFHILEETTDPSQSSPEDFSYNNLKADSHPDIGNNKNFQLERGFQMLDWPDALRAESRDLVMFYPSSNPEASDARIGGSFDSVENSAMVVDGVKLQTSSQISSPVHNYSGSLNEGYSRFQGDQVTEHVGVMQSELPSCSTTSSFAEGDANHVADHVDVLDINFLLDENVDQFRHVGGKVDSEDALCSPWMDSLDGKSGQCGAPVENSLGISGPESDFDKSMDLSIMDADVSSHNVISSYSSDVTSELGTHYPAMQFGINAGGACYTGSVRNSFPGGCNFELLSNNAEVMTNRMGEIGEFLTESSYSVLPMPMVDYFDVKGQNFKCEGRDYMSPIGRHFSSNSDCIHIDDKVSVTPFGYIESGINKKQTACIEDENIDEVVASRSKVRHSAEALNEAISQNYSCSDVNDFFVDEDVKRSASACFMGQKHVVYTVDEKGDKNVACVGDCLSSRFSIDDTHLNLINSDQYYPCGEPSNITNMQQNCTKDEREGELIQPKGFISHLSRVSPESIESNSSGSKSHIDDDSDICILEDISQTARSSQSLQSVRAIVPLHHSACGDTHHYAGVGGMRLRVNDEHIIFRAALQDLSQPKSEASPPEGLLAVPLLRHQRIALSWMVQKETFSLHCSGGILADDQGLGKTISTIALILKERPPSVRAAPDAVKKEEFETLDLDEDDDGVTIVDGVKQGGDSCRVKDNRSSTQSISSSGQSKGRPAAGTLVVCPTSVLRQWDEELHKKVTNEANLSVLVYHGSNRTKDPCELAKYDVVLTTYSIVSMEVPKQPLVDEDDDEKGTLEGNDVASLGLLSGKKRKCPPSSGKNGPKNKKGMDSTLFDAVARPLAKVAWFRVVLDEAQSIKNRRTQVARACWGLRAKRRWCLSGTPIQNAIDDLYSYFRFLRYDPYAAYNSFCSTIKIPIQKNPTKGYKKLQAVLKTIMLRRTKGTIIDGEPIILLPPKVIELKKVDFMEEERESYTRLETDFRAQFKEYADAGTVKQNYVNILLMLLRLRQACDHPLLGKGLDSNSLGRSSIEMAKKLSREKQINLLNCLEASLAICGICNDPPEDAVVSVCGHVFCNQCISEHLTGDDNQCPVSNCKVRLNLSTVFSKVTLNSTLYGQSGQDGSGSESVELVNPNSVGCPYDSSKIRAALEVLQSLTKAQDCTSANSSSHGKATSPENSSGSENSLPVNKNVNDSIKAAGEKAIVFSQWTGMLDLLEACLKRSSIQYRRLDGTMSVLARDRAVKDFNSLPEVSVMIMSLKAASLGLNMVAACRVLLLDLWWNPTTEDQAIDRAHRIGQTRPVTVLRLTVKDTVEDRILALQQKKREMVASAFGEDETGSRQTRLTEEDLRYLFMA